MPWNLDETKIGILGIDGGWSIKKDECIIWTEHLQTCMNCAWNACMWYGVMMVPGEVGINCQLPSQKRAWFCKMFVFDIPAVTDCQNENSIHLWTQELELNM